MANISIQSLQVVLGGQKILSELNLEVQDREFLVLLGSSGCGKSTLLHSIAGLIDVDSGTVQIAGQDVTYADPKDRGIGMVFQNYALYPTMTVERNMSFGPRLAGVPKAEIAQRVQQTAAMLQLTPLLDRKPAQLSGGQRQRVAIGRALVRQAAVFLFDEPLSNLDAKLRAQLRRELKELHAQLQATMVYVTHDQVEAMTLGTRIAVMRDGKIQQIDTPAVVYHQPANMFVAGFLGSPSMNFFTGSLSLKGEQLWFDNDLLSVPLRDYVSRGPLSPGQAVVLGLRPEHLSCGEQPLGTPSYGVEMRVKWIEPMGAQQVIWLEKNNENVAVMATGTFQTQAGQTLRIQPAMEQACLFDPQTQERL